MNKINENTTLLELYNIWLENDFKPSKPNAAPATLWNYDYYGRLIKQNFDRRVVDISISEYRETMDRIGKKVGFDTLRRVQASIRNALNYAEPFFDYPDFTFKSAIKPEKKKKPQDLKFFDEVDFDRIIDYLKDGCNELLGSQNMDKAPHDFVLLTQAWTGLRIGEALALCWEDIVKEKDGSGTIHTYRRYSSAQKRFTAKKTDMSNRYIPINEKLMNLLKEWHKLQIKENEKKKTINQDNQVFQYWKNPVHVVPSAEHCNDRLKAICKKLNIDTWDRFSNYALRHSRITKLIAAGVPSNQISAVMGTSEIEILQTYSHLFQKQKMEGWDTMKKIE